MKLTVGISKSTLSLDRGVKQETVAIVKDALAFYEEQFGAYPLDPPLSVDIGVGETWLEAKK